jgi:outer membrane protein assembly factor BamC
MRTAYLALILGCAVLSACAPGTQYRKAEPIEPMRTPDGIDFEGSDPLYTVPEPERRAAFDPDNKKFRAPEPPQLRAPIDKKTEREESAPAPGTRIESVLTRDGNGYPIIMLRARFAWAWEKVNGALEAGGFRVNDRDRDAGLFYLKLSKADAGVKKARLKLSQTANGIQVALLQSGSQELLDKAVARPLLKRLHEQL